MNRVLADLLAQLYAVINGDRRPEEGGVKIQVEGLSPRTVSLVWHGWQRDRTRGARHDRWAIFFAAESRLFLGTDPRGWSGLTVDQAMVHYFAKKEILARVPRHDALLSRDRGRFDFMKLVGYGVDVFAASTTFTVAQAAY